MPARKEMRGAPWSEYLIIAKIIDLFCAYRKLKGTENVNLDIASFCDQIQYKLIDIYGKE
jgi:hypothetical protein